jgi:hypothetical protein
VIGQQSETSSKKVRGKAKASLALINAMSNIAETIQPVTGRGIGYKLFSRQLIPSMSRKDMQRVYRLLKEAREQGIIPWSWIVDEGRYLEKRRTWSNPDEYMSEMQRRFRREFWDQQPVRVEVWSEKGTVRGVLAPVLDKYGVGFRVMHGFSSATVAYDAATDDDGRDLIVIYVGDYDPSGLFMSQEDLPARLKKYGGDHVEIRRIALTSEQTTGLISFPASDKAKDPRYKWFTANHGQQCWELDALDPNDLRSCVEAAIEDLIEPEAWERCEVVNAAERASISDFLGKWNAPNWVEEFMQANTETGVPA